MFIYFDTSAINALYDDPECERVAAGLTSMGTFRASAFNVSEVAGTRDRERRKRLLLLIAILADGTVPLQIPNMILRGMLRAHADGQSDFSTEVAVNDDAILALRSPDLITDESREMASEWTKNVEALFDSDAVSMRERMQRARKADKKPYHSSAGALIRHMMFDPGDAYRKFVAAMYLVETGKMVSASVLDQLMQHPAWKLFFGGFTFALHRRSMRSERHARWRHAGALDLQQAVYLAFSDFFVTADVQQYRALRMLNVLNRCETNVYRYSDFRRRFELEAASGGSANSVQRPRAMS
jgi:hypothetical protein